MKEEQVTNVNATDSADEWPEKLWLSTDKIENADEANNLPGLKSLSRWATSTMTKEGRNTMTCSVPAGKATASIKGLLDGKLPKKFTYNTLDLGSVRDTLHSILAGLQVTYMDSKSQTIAVTPFCLADVLVNISETPNDQVFIAALAVDKVPGDDMEQKRAHVGQMKMHELRAFAEASGAAIVVLHPGHIAAIPPGSLVVTVAPIASNPTMVRWGVFHKSLKKCVEKSLQLMLQTYSVLKSSDYNEVIKLVQAVSDE